MVHLYLDALRLQPFFMFIVIIQLLCSSLGVDRPLVFLLWLPWETVYRLCHLLNYVPPTLVVLASLLLLVFPPPGAPIHASSTPIPSFLLKTSTSSALKSFRVSLQWAFMALHGTNVWFGVRKEPLPLSLTASHSQRLKSKGDWPLPRLQPLVRSVGHKVSARDL